MIHHISRLLRQNVCYMAAPSGGRFGSFSIILLSKEDNMTSNVELRLGRWEHYSVNTTLAWKQEFQTFRERNFLHLK